MKKRENIDSKEFSAAEAETKPVSFAKLPDIENTVAQFSLLMEKLKAERDQLVQRIEAVDRLLGTTQNSGPPPRPKNPFTLKELLIDILKDKPKGLTKSEILEAVNSRGYEFYGQRPLGSLNVVLYTRKNGFRKTTDSQSGEVRFLPPTSK